MLAQLEQMAKDRDEALLSLNKGKIVAYCRKYGIPLPENETAFWAGVHKSIIALNAATKAQKEKSVLWLAEHGFTTEIG